MTRGLQDSERAAYEQAVDELAEDCFFAVLLGGEWEQDRVVAPGEVKSFTDGFTWAAAIFAAKLDAAAIRAMHATFLRERLEERIVELGE